jgi:hypothetical protein
VRDGKALCTDETGLQPGSGWEAITNRPTATRSGWFVVGFLKLHGISLPAGPRRRSEQKTKDHLDSSLHFGAGIGICLLRALAATGPRENKEASLHSGRSANVRLSPSKSKYSMCS